MADEFDAKLYFESAATESDTFRVVDFKGTEEISRPFRFEINLISSEPEIDLKAVIGERAFLGLERNGELRKIHGVLSEFEQGEWIGRHYRYRAVLVPRLWLLSLRKQCQVYTKEPDALTGWSDGLTIQKILEDELQGAGLASDDYEINLTETHPYREYVAQYQETDLDFISRLMEHEGIFYFFEHDDDKDKLIIADSNDRFGRFEGTSELVFRPPTGMVNVEREAVQKLFCKERRIPRELKLKDYNWRTPNLDLTVTETIDDASEGLVCEYGNHYKDVEEDGPLYARFRAEEIRCRQTRYQGESNGIAFRAGFVYELTEHFRPDFDGEYLIVGVRHRGSQSSPGAEGSDEGDERPSYGNRFVTIRSDVQYRPPRVTPKPKILGAVNAKIDSSGDGEFAEIDEHGRYRIALAFDQRTDLAALSGGAQSRWVRKAQPYSGGGYGMHFPLHKGAEVIVTHVDGDPDRPVIAGAVPNPETPPPVAQSNHRANTIRTSGGNQLIMDDTPGREGLFMTNGRGSVHRSRARLTDDSANRLQTAESELQAGEEN
jgi:type VI secretion system secreted protein VgrG